VRRILFPAWLFSVLFTGCTITKVVHHGDDDFASKLNQRGLYKTGTVAASDGRMFEARAIRLDGDSLTFMRVWDRRIAAVSSPEVIKMGAHQVRDIKFVDHGNGAIEGLLFGAVGGFAVGFGIGAASAHESCEGFLDLTCGSPASVGAGFGILFAMPSALVGLIGGAVRGKQYRFQFNPTRPIRYGRPD